MVICLRLVNIKVRFVNIFLRFVYIDVHAFCLWRTASCKWMAGWVFVFQEARCWYWQATGPPAKSPLQLAPSENPPHFHSRHQDCRLPRSLWGFRCVRDWFNRYGREVQENFYPSVEWCAETSPGVLSQGWSKAVRPSSQNGNVTFTTLSFYHWNGTFCSLFYTFCNCFRLMFSQRWNTSCPHFGIPSRAILCTAVLCHKSGSMAASKHTTSSRSSQVDDLILLWLFTRMFRLFESSTLEAHLKQQATCSSSLFLAPRRTWWPRFKIITRCMLLCSHGRSTTGTKRCPRADIPLSQIRCPLVFILWRFVTKFDFLSAKIDDL